MIGQTRLWGDFGWIACLAAAVAALSLCVAAPAWAANETAGSASGLPIPRFVSLKAEKVNVRAGPTLSLIHI